MSMGVAPGGAWVTERGTVVPSWTPTHKPETEVRLDGETLGFAVKDMLPERRWAVDEFGHVLEAREFKEQFQRWFASHSKKEDPVLVAVPDRLEFVSGAYDRDGKATFIGFDPGDPSKVKPSEKYAHTGEVFVEHQKTVAASAEKEGARKALRDLWKAGTLNAGQYAEALERLEGGGVSSPEATIATEAVTEAPEITVDDVVEAARPDVLTAREREVLEHIGRTGPVSNEMAEKVGTRLSLSPSSIRSMVSKARSKLAEAGL